jgi:hypothetical protein
MAVVVQQTLYPNGSHSLGQPKWASLPSLLYRLESMAVASKTTLTFCPFAIIRAYASAWAVSASADNLYFFVHSVLRFQH